MPTELILHVISAADVERPPRLDALGDVSIAEWFAEETGRELRLSIREHRSESASVDIAGDGLQAMFREFVPSPSPGELASEIALLFCRSWCFRNLAGLMFDYDGADLPPGARLVFDGVPRQACAVFLDGLEAQLDDPYLFVAIHELGHVFNLHHDRTDRSFMGLDVDGPRTFLPADSARLTAAAAGEFPEREQHLPGGAPFVADARFALAGSRRRVVRTHRGGSLDIRVASASFLLGEPVVVDATLRLPRGARLADGGLDPGFPGVRVWYRTPVGEVRLFAPLRHYCGVGRRRPRASTVIRNNMRVHLGRRGLTFREPGRYELWVEADTRIGRDGGATLVSPAAAFEIRAPRDARECALCEGLSDPQIAHFVANRAGALDAARADVVARLLVDAAPAHPIARHLRYAAATRALRSGDRDAASDLLRGVRFPERSLRAAVNRLHRAITGKPLRPASAAGSALSAGRRGSSACP